MMTPKEDTHQARMCAKRIHAQRVLRSHTYSLSVVCWNAGIAVYFCR